MKKILVLLLGSLLLWQACQSEGAQMKGPLTATYDWFGWEMEIPKGWTLVEAPVNPVLTNWDKLVSAQKDSSHLLVLTSKAYNYAPGETFGNLIAEQQKTFGEIKVANSFIAIDTIQFSSIHMRKFRQPGQVEPPAHEFWAEWKSKNDLFLFGMIAPTEEEIETMKQIILGSSFSRRD